MQGWHTGWVTYQANLQDMKHGWLVRLHRTALRFAHDFRRVYWHAFQPRIWGCVLFLTREDGAILLVRHSYGTGRWTLPGGGIAHGEMPVDAARREAIEELGLQPEQLCLIERSEEDLFGARNRVHLFAGRIVGEPSIDGREVIEAGFFLPDALPEPIANRALDWLESGLTSN